DRNLANVIVEPADIPPTILVEKTLDLVRRQARSAIFDGMITDLIAALLIALFVIPFGRGCPGRRMAINVAITRVVTGSRGCMPTIIQIRGSSRLKLSCGHDQDDHKHGVDEETRSVRHCLVYSKIARRCTLPPIPPPHRPSLPHGKTAGHRYGRQLTIIHLSWHSIKFYQIN